MKLDKGAATSIVLSSVRNLCMYQSTPTSYNFSHHNIETYAVLHLEALVSGYVVFFDRVMCKFSFNPDDDAHTVHPLLQ